MFPLIKLLKIALPVATVTSTTIATTFLVSSGKKDLDKKTKDIDEKLNDFKKPSEDFKDKKMYYSKNSNQKGLVALDKDLSPDLLAEIEKKIKDLPSGQNLPNTGEDIQKLLSDSSPQTANNEKIPDTIDVSNRVQNNEEDTTQVKNSIEPQVPTKDLSQTEEGADDFSKQADSEKLGPKNKESEGHTNDLQSVKHNNSDRDAKEDESTKSISQSQVTSEESKDEGGRGQEPEKTGLEDSKDGIKASQEGEGQLASSPSEPSGSQPESDIEATAGNLDNQTNGFGKSQSNEGTEDHGSNYGSHDSKNNLGTDFSGGDMTPEKLKELSDIKGQVEDLLGSLENMLNTIS